MSKLKLLASLLPAFLMAGNTADPKTGYKYLTKTDRLKLKEFHEAKVKNVLSQKGVQEYTIHGYTVMARNRKNAERKINNLKNQK